MLQHVLRRGRLESARLLGKELLDLPVLDDHGVALAAHPHAVLGQVHRQAHRLGELARAIGQHQDLVPDLLVFAPGTHHEGVID